MVVWRVTPKKPLTSLETTIPYLWKTMVSSVLKLARPRNY